MPIAGCDAAGASCVDVFGETSSDPWRLEARDLPQMSWFFTPQLHTLGNLQGDDHVPSKAVPLRCPGRAVSFG